MVGMIEFMYVVKFRKVVRNNFNIHYMNSMGLFCPLDKDRKKSAG